MMRTVLRFVRLLAAVLLATVMAGVTFAQQQATLLGTLSGHTDPVYAVAWSPDGKTIATAGFDNTVRLWEAATRKEIKGKSPVIRDYSNVTGRLGLGPRN